MTDLQATIVEQPFGAPSAPHAQAYAYQAAPAAYAGPANGYAAPAAGYAEPAQGYAGYAGGYTPPPPPGYAPPASPVPGVGRNKLTPGALFAVAAIVAGGWYFTHQPKHHTTVAAGPVVTQPVRQPASPSVGRPAQPQVGQPSQPTQPVRPSEPVQPTQPAQPATPASTAAIANLISHVPSDIAATCQPVQSSSGAPEVQCSAGSGITVFFAQYQTAGDAQTALDAVLQGAQLVAGPNCPSGQCSYTNNHDQGDSYWFAENGSSGPLVGVAWDSQATNIAAAAVQSGTDNSAVASWWAQDGAIN